MRKALQVVSINKTVTADLENNHVRQSEKNDLFFDIVAYLNLIIKTICFLISKIFSTS